MAERSASSALLIAVSSMFTFSSNVEILTLALCMLCSTGSVIAAPYGPNLFLATFVGFAGGTKGYPFAYAQPEVISRRSSCVSVS